MDLLHSLNGLSYLNRLSCLNGLSSLNRLDRLCSLNNRRHGFVLLSFLNLFSLSIDRGRLAGLDNFSDNGFLNLLSGHGCSGGFFLCDNSIYIIRD